MPFSRRKVKKKEWNDLFWGKLEQYIGYYAISWIPGWKC